MDAQGPAFGDVWNELASSARRLHRGSNTVSIAAPGFAFLVAEGEDGAHQPLGPVATIAEAGAMAGEDLGHRVEELERAGERENRGQ